MQRVRKTIDRASALKQFAPRIDIHTGNIGKNGPPGVRYIAHMAYADKLWNGEGFDWNLDPDYWLVEVSHCSLSLSSLLFLSSSPCA